MNSSERVGTIRALWRFPVKSMLGEELDAADLGEGGIVGDRAYGGPLHLVSERGSVRAVGRIALHAAWVEVTAQGEEPFRVDAPLPEDLVAIWATCGGDGSAWKAACEPLEVE